MIKISMKGKYRKLRLEDLTDSQKNFLENIKEKHKDEIKNREVGFDSTVQYWENWTDVKDHRKDGYGCERRQFGNTYYIEALPGNIIYRAMMHQKRPHRNRNRSEPRSGQQDPGSGNSGGEGDGPNSGSDSDDHSGRDDGASGGGNSGKRDRSQQDQSNSQTSSSKFQRQAATAISLSVPQSTLVDSALSDTNDSTSLSVNGGLLVDSMASLAISNASESAAHSQDREIRSEEKRKTDQSTSYSNHYTSDGADRNGSDKDKKQSDASDSTGAGPDRKIKNEEKRKTDQSTSNSNHYTSDDADRNGTDKDKKQSDASDSTGAGPDRKIRNEEKRKTDLCTSNSNHYTSDGADRNGTDKDKKQSDASDSIGAGPDKMKAVVVDTLPEASLTLAEKKARALPKIRRLISIIQQKDVKDKAYQEACRELSNLSGWSYHAAWIANEGGIEALLHSMERPYLCVASIECAAKTLGYMCSLMNTFPEIVSLLLKADFLRSIANLMEAHRDQDQPVVVEECFEILVRVSEHKQVLLAMASDESISAGTTARVVDACLSAMWLGRTSLVQEVWLFNRLSSHPKLAKIVAEAVPIPILEKRLPEARSREALKRLKCVQTEAKRKSEAKRLHRLQKKTESQPNDNVSCVIS